MQTEIETIEEEAATPEREKKNYEELFGSKKFLVCNPEKKNVPQQVNEDLKPTVSCLISSNTIKEESERSDPAIPDNLNIGESMV